MGTENECASRRVPWRALGRRYCAPPSSRSASSMPLPTWPPELSEEQRELLCRQGTDFALSHSILYRPLPESSSSTPPLDAAIHAPISLFPTPFPRSLYEQGQALQPLYNDLYARVAVDDAFLRRVIGGNVILVDDFQERIWQIWKHVKDEGAVQVGASRVRPGAAVC